MTEILAASISPTDSHRIIFSEGTNIAMVKKVKCGSCPLGYSCGGPDSAGGSIFADVQGDRISPEQVKSEAKCLK
ncbi:MAG: hypothetical protein QY322_02075 [bacterium]|nr:MAG: hypothetical protein QY322_02075 [bacterium]